MTTAAPVRALVRRGLIDRRAGILAWGLGGGLLCAFTAAVYPSVQDSIGQAIEGYPQGLKDAFGIESLATVEEYLSAEAFGWIVPMAVAFFAIRSVVRSIAAQEDAGRLDTLLAAPLSRRALVAAALLTAAIAIPGVLALVGVLTWAAAALFGADLSLGLLAAGVANVWPFALFFAGLALVATGLRPGAAVVTGASGLVLVSMYVIDLVGKLSEPVEFLRYASVFRYYGAALEDGLDPAAFVGIAAAGCVLAGLGAVAFERRDVAG